MKQSFNDRIVETYGYEIEKGVLLFEIVKLRDPKSFRARRPNGTGSWIWNLDGVARIPYRLPQLHAGIERGEVVLWLGGEKDVQAAEGLGFVATTNPFGEKTNPAPEFFAAIGRARAIVRIADNDEAGLSGAHKHAAAAVKYGIPDVRVVAFPTDRPNHYDLSNFVEDGGTREQLLALIEEAQPLDRSLTDNAKATAHEPGAKDRAKQNIADVLVRLVRDEVELVHDERKMPYAIVRAENGNRTVLPIRGEAFTAFLRDRYIEKHDRTINSTAIADARALFDALAIRNHMRVSIALRYEERPGELLVDLGDDTRRVVRISAEGWTVMNPPDDIYFYRPDGQSPLPEPTRGGSLAEWTPFLHLDNDNTLRLVMGVLCAMRKQGPFPIVPITGEHGSAKSTTANMAKELVDPEAAQLMIAPRNQEDLIAAIADSHCSVLDNVSSEAMKTWLSDALCGISMGIADKRREKYTTLAQRSTYLCKPVFLTSIERTTVRPDLADRVIPVRTSPFPPGRSRARKADKALRASFTAAKPRILGALYDVISTVLRRLPALQQNDELELPRLAGPGLWTLAAEPALIQSLGIPEYVEDLAQGKSPVMTVWDAAYEEAASYAMSDSPIVNVLIELLRRHVSAEKAWEILPRLCFEELTSLARERTNGQLPPGFPKSSQGLTNQLARLANALAAYGVRWSPPDRTKNTKLRVYTFEAIREGDRLLPSFLKS